MKHVESIGVFVILLSALSAEPVAHADEGDKIVVEIITEIRPDDVQAGVKSHQTIAIDTVNQTATSTFETGKTNLKVVEINSIRDGFTMPQHDFAGNLIHIQVKGETASGVGILGSIDYHLTVRINKAQHKVWMSGTHNEYPSYTVKINGAVVYDRKQTGNPVTGLIDALSTVQVGVEGVAF